jgi:aspartate aminotransferase
MSNDSLPVQQQECGGEKSFPTARQVNFDDLTASFIGDTAERLAALPADKRYPLHLGKSWFSAPYRLDHSDVPEFGQPLFQDGPPQGFPALVSAIKHSLEKRLGRAFATSQIQVTNGISHGLYLTFGALLKPGDSVLILSPQWLFVTGMVRSFGAAPVEVPYFLSHRPRSPKEIFGLLDKYITSQSKAIYFNTPNNPTGISLYDAEVRAVFDYANRHSLFIISDNAYRDYNYIENDFPDPLGLDQYSESVVSLYSFSKSHGWTGFRVGYVVAPPRLAEAIAKLSLHSIFCVPTASQYVALQGITAGECSIAVHREEVTRSREILQSQCIIPCSAGDGGFYTMLDLTQYAGGAARFIDLALNCGVSLVHGSAFGPHCPQGARLCYTAVTPDRLIEAISILNQLYNEG